MSALVERFVAWIKGEPVRVRLYSLAALVLAYLLARGIVSPTDVEFVGGVLALILGVEGSRRKVTPYDPQG